MVGFVGTGVTEEEEEDCDHIMTVGNRTSAIATARRIFGWFETFLEENPGVADERAVPLFICQLRRACYNGGQRVRNAETVRDYSDVVTKFQMGKGRMKEARAKIDRAAFAAGLRELAKKHETSRDNRAIPRDVAAWPATGAARCIHWKAACYLLMATGCRAKHLAQIRSLRFDRLGLQVRWLVRKVRSGGNNEWTYSYFWSFTPTDDVKEVLERQWESFQGALGDAEGIASRVNAYLRARCAEMGVSPFTSRYYRCRMSTILCGALREGKISRAEFEMLLDHEHRLASTRFLLRLKTCCIRTTREALS